MLRLRCPRCSARLFFENSHCLRCGTAVGFAPESLAMEATTGRRACGHREGVIACNWLLTSAERGSLCASCALTRTAPDLSAPGADARWRLLEQDKRRLCYALTRAGLGAHLREMRFDVLADPQALSGGPPAVAMGHLQGVITLNLAEADPSYRERARDEMSEAYRTVLGHLRHESGHFMFPRLVSRDPDRLARFRALFGDERQDYAQALRAHHQGRTWSNPDDHVSRYAASHPHEDWAEHWAHVLHVLDTLETATAFDMQITEGVSDPYDEVDFGRLLERFQGVVQIANELNRSLGQGDAYPFVAAEGARRKLAFVHETLRAAA